MRQFAIRCRVGAKPERFCDIFPQTAQGRSQDAPDRARLSPSSKEPSAAGQRGDLSAEVSSSFYRREPFATAVGAAANKGSAARRDSIAVQMEAAAVKGGDQQMPC